MLLSDIAKGLCEGDIEIRGRKVRARAVSAAESGRIQKLRPAPQPPPTVRPGLKPGEDPNENVIYNERDPRYIADYAEWTRWIKAVELAIGLGLEFDGQKFQSELNDGALLAWCNRAADEVCRTLTREELSRAWEAVMALGTNTPERMEAAQGN